MSVEEVARAQYGVQQSLAEQAGKALLALWALLDPTGLAASWAALRLAERMFTTLATYQLAAASPAQRYVAALLGQQGATSAPRGVLNGSGLAGIASDGRPLESLVAQPLIETLTAIQSGATVEDALAQGGHSLVTIGQTQVADAGRTAESIANTVEPAVFGYVRMLVPPSCGRCAALAGKWFGWNSGFERHPRCDCRHIAAAEDAVGDLRTDPRAYFDSLSIEEQGRYFTVAGAEAIRAGADIAQVVNARRGASGLSSPGRLTAAEQKVLKNGRDKGRLDRVDVYGQQVFITTEGTTRHGVAGKKLKPGTPRLMPESCLQLANGDRDMAIRLLKRFGYILD